MAIIFINSAEICNMEGEVLPFDDTFQSYSVEFNPSTTGGETNDIFLKVMCAVDPRLPTKLKFVLKQMNQADFIFIPSNSLKDPLRMTYTRKVLDQKAVFLKFKLSNLKNIEKCLLCRIQMTISEFLPTPPSNEVSENLRIKAV